MARTPDASVNEVFDLALQRVWSLVQGTNQPNVKRLVEMRDFTRVQVEATPA